MSAGSVLRPARHVCSSAWPKRTSGSRRLNGFGRYHAHRPSSRSSTGSITSRTSAASSSTATPRITPISFGGSGPTEGECDEDRNHDRAGREDHAARCRPCRRPSPPWRRRPSAPSAPWPRPGGTPCSPSRSRRSSRRRTPGAHASRKPCGSKPAACARRRPGRSTSRPERGGGREQVRDHAERGDHRRLQRDHQQQEAEAEDDADDQRHCADSVDSRSWFSATGPPTRDAGGSVARRRSIVAPVALAEGSVSGSPPRAPCRRRPAAPAARWRCPDRAGPPPRPARPRPSAQRSAAAPSHPGRTPLRQRRSPAESCCRRERP